MAAKSTISNPFSITSYLGAAYFCDREKETRELAEALYNRRNVTLISPRRIGKTGLIQHLFHSLNPKEIHCIYVDLYGTTNLTEFTKKLAEAILSAEITPFSERVWKEISQVFASIRPVFTPDPITGMLQCTIDLQPHREEWTIQQLFAYLEQSKTPCYIALDEFQTIAEYTDCKMEAILRGYIQHLNNCRFIFAGSKKHIMLQMFTSANRPFFQSTQIMHIDVIDEAAYYAFAEKHFSAHKQHISEEAFHALYSVVDGCTWYIQALLNRLYQLAMPQIDQKAVWSALCLLVEELTPTYQMYSRLLTQRQMQILQAIAKESAVKEPGSNAFLQKYSLGAYSTVRSAIISLYEKELLYQKDDGSYVVYDKFFAHWLRSYLM